MAQEQARDTGPPNAVVYGAKSSRDDHGSIPTQLADGRALAERDGLVVFGEYTDEAASAWSGDRGPGLVQARAEAERLAREHGECHFIVQHSDRLARGDGIQAAHLVEYSLWAIKSGVKLRSIQDPQTFSDLLYAVVTGQRNNEDSERRSKSIRDGKARAREAGRPNGGPRSFGTRYEDGELVVVEQEAPLVRRIFTALDAGKAKRRIARELDAEGIPTTRGGRWRSSSIHSVAKNRLYVELEIVEKEMFERVNVLLASRATGPGRPPNGPHLFRNGALRCGECGEAMSPRTTPRGWEGYICTGRHNYSNCSMPSVEREHIDRAVFAYFAEVALDAEATRAQLAEARNVKLLEVRALREQAEAEARKADDRLARVRRDYQDGAIVREDWTEQREQLTGEREGAHAEADRLRAQEREVEGWGELKDVEAETLRRLAEIRAAIVGEVRDAEGIESVRAALNRTFDRFVLHGSVPERVHVELIGDCWIEPIPREQAIVGYSENLRPILRRSPLPLGTGNNVEVATATPPLFGPIPVGAP